MCVGMAHEHHQALSLPAVWLPTAAMSSYLPSDTYGRNNVQRSSTAMLYTMASDPAVDITGNGNTGTASGGLTIGGASDSLGPLTDFGGNTNGYKLTSALDPAIFNAVDAKFSIEVRASVNFNADTYFAQYTSDASGDNVLIIFCYQNRVTLTATHLTENILNGPHQAPILANAKSP